MRKSNEPKAAWIWLAHTNGAITHDVGNTALDLDAHIQYLLM